MTFIRGFSVDRIKALKGSALFMNKLKNCIGTGEVFPAIRKNKMHFYYYGGRLFEFDGKFKTHSKYGFVPTNEDGYIYESTLITIQPAKDFESGFDKIKKRCLEYAKVEAMGVSALYKFSAWSKNTVEDGIVLLDIEAMFSKNNDTSTSKFDIVLYNGKNQEILVVEAKHFSNSGLWSSQNKPEVNAQLKRYNDIIKKKKGEILDAYSNQIQIMNGLFGKSFNPPKAICEDVGLLIFGFDRNQLSKIPDNYAGKAYKIGNIDNIEASTLYKKLK